MKLFGTIMACLLLVMVGVALDRVILSPQPEVVRDTTWLKSEPIYSDPEPATIQALVQAELEDTMLHIYKELPVYRDSTHKTIYDTTTVVIEAGTPRVQIDTTLGFTYETITGQRKKVNQGQLKLTMWGGKQFGLYSLSWKSNGQQLGLITETITPKIRWYTTRWAYMSYGAVGMYLLIRGLKATL